MVVMISVMVKMVLEPHYDFCGCGSNTLEAEVYTWLHLGYLFRIGYRIYLLDCNLMLFISVLIMVTVIASHSTCALHANIDNEHCWLVTLFYILSLILIYHLSGGSTCVHWKNLLQVTTWSGTGKKGRVPSELLQKENGDNDQLIHTWEKSRLGGRQCIAERALNGHLRSICIQKQLKKDHVCSIYFA